MPKKPSKNGFMTFTFDWKSKYGRNLSLAEATTECGRIWASMTAQERAPYNERAKQEKMGLKTGAAPKLTCRGKPIDVVEKERQDVEQRERRMKRTIELTVRNSVKNDQLDTQTYHFIMVNYFVRSLRGGIYVPAEISVVKYSLKEGLCRLYHSFINPGPELYGLQYEAQHHSDNTHKLPLPPHAKGETDLGLIYNNILDFIRDPETGEYPPVYTHRDSIPVVASVLDYLKGDYKARNIEFETYSIQYLFYILKEATCEMGELEKPTSSFVTDAFWDNDFFEYQIDIACTYHEEIDKSKYCTQSIVTRWAFTFSDYMCCDIAIDMIPGRHVPKTTNLAAIINPAPSTYADTESQISVNSESTYATKAVCENKIYYDEPNAYAPARSYNSGRSTLPFEVNDFPSLGPGSSRKKHASNYAIAPAKTSRMHSAPHQAMDSDSPDSTVDINPWSMRSLHVPRKPDTSHFDINYTRDETTDSEASTPLGYGRGRMRNNVSTASVVSAGSGRGRLFQRLNN
ncbi:protein maelstrom 1 [Zeugodacus cucurbitae]|uniref:protein maelstrom 1 n=1 Tax=Zeugodacus cucurbitae TaxID=28588 RepID=UPI0023D949B1|nr:protein maelstrom 1 [Zeugodacus cucurbitae]